MAVEIRMPSLSEEMTEGVVVQWKLQEGARAEKGQVLVEVEVDKAIVEIEAPQAGILAARAAAEGRLVTTGEVLAVLAHEGEDIEAIRSAVPAHTRQPVRRKPPPDEADVLRALPLHGMRGAVARRATRSILHSPQFQVTMDCDAEKLQALRKLLRRSRETRHISLNAIVLKCVATALMRHPIMNSRIIDDVIYSYVKTHIGIAVAVPNGVVVPVLRDVAGKPLRQVSEELDEIVRAARSRRLHPDQMEGGTFTVSTLGNYGVHHFTAILYPPQVGIVSMGAVRSEPVVRNGQVVPGKRVALTASVDHRAVDGAEAAEFMQTLRSLVEDPDFLLE